MPGLTQRALIVDSAVAAAFIAIAEVEAVLGLATREAWVHALLSPLFLAPLALRRRFPLLAFVAAELGLVVLDPKAALSFFGAVVLASYSAGATVEGRRTYAVPLLALGLFGVTLAGGEGAPSDLVAFALFFGGPWWVGRLVRQRVQQADELVRLAERESERERVAAIGAERDRIARELHDIVAHSISVVGVQAQAVRRRLGPGHEREVQDLRAIETAARQAMGEMRRLFGVLRADGSPAALEPQPGLDQLERLVVRMRASGLPVSVEIEGPRVPLPPGVDLAAYRIVQESLTNVVRHAGSAPARVRLAFRDSDLEVTVVDEGPGAGVVDGGGHGLLGMRERVALYGGVLEAGSVNGRGFRVYARLPFRESSG